MWGGRVLAKPHCGSEIQCLSSHNSHLFFEFFLTEIFVDGKNFPQLIHQLFDKTQIRYLNRRLDFGFGLVFGLVFGSPCGELVELCLQKKVFVPVLTMPNDKDMLANCPDV